jgi:hypothetical protein
MHYIFNQQEYTEEETIKNRLIEILHYVIKLENFLKIKKLKKVEEFKQKSKRKTQKPLHLWS